MPHCAKYFPGQSDYFRPCYYSSTLTSEILCHPNPNKHHGHTTTWHNGVKPNHRNYFHLQCISSNFHLTTCSTHTKRNENADHASSSKNNLRLWMFMVGAVRVLEADKMSPHVNLGAVTWLPEQRNSSYKAR